MAAANHQQNRLLVSVYLDSGIDLAYEGVSRVEPDRSSEEKESEDHQCRVAKVEQRRNELGYLQLKTRQQFTNIDQQPVQR